MDRRSGHIQPKPNTQHPAQAVSARERWPDRWLHRWLLNHSLANTVGSSLTWTVGDLLATRWLTVGRRANYFINIQ